MTCPMCNGTGKVAKKFLFLKLSGTCPQCDGKRWVANPNPVRPKVTRLPPPAPKGD